MRKAVLIFLILSGQFINAQIVDDSTRNVYGAHSTLWTSERFLKDNIQNAYTNPDTSVYLFEKYHLVDKSNRRLQDLGFLGSPMFDASYAAPLEAGRTFGFDGYDLYFKTVDEIKYFDTKSPFMNVGVVFGGQNRSKIDFAFSRNVNENWNLGFDLNRITADKQIARASVGDRNVESASFDFYTHYKHGKLPYQVAFSILSLKHEVADIGGVYVEDGAPRADYFIYQDGETQLENATTSDLRSRLHLYQQFELGSGFQVYHQLDKTTQEYKYFDLSESASSKYDDFYPSFNLNSDTTAEKSTYTSFVNEVGLKGDIKGAFYRFYAKYRSLVYDTKYMLEESVGETFAGTYLRFNWKDRFEVSGNGELSNEGFYKLRGELSSNRASLSYTSVRSSPSFQSMNYEGNHHNWKNSFDPVFSNTVKGTMDLKWNVFSIQPEASFTTINNLVYRDENQVSMQASVPVIISQIGVRIDMDFLRGFSFFKMTDKETFRLENEVKINTISGAGSDLVRLPAIQYNARLFWRGALFQNAVPAEIGTDFYSRTAYYANAYDPVTSQFYLQDELRLESYFAVDFFVNMKIQNLTTFIKWTYINQQANDGYMSTPYYPAQKSITDFGVRWLFFD